MALSPTLASNDIAQIYTGIDTTFCVVWYEFLAHGEAFFIEAERIVGIVE